MAFLVGLWAYKSRLAACPLGVDVGGAAWSPDGEKIAFVGHGSTGFHIYTLKIATRRVTQLTESHCGNEVWPSWSRVGQRLAYQRSNGQRGIYLTRPDGGGARLIIPGDASAPAWAPDGTRLAYVVRGKLYVDPFDRKGHPVRLNTGDYLVDFPVWSPDGKWIAFNAAPSPDVFPSVREIGVHRSRVSSVVADGIDATWSPNGEWLAYEVYSNFYRPTEIRITGRAGTKDRLVHNVPQGNAVPAWSPDGSTIAIYWYPSGSQGRHAILYLVRRDGTGFRRIYAAQ